MAKISMVNLYVIHIKKRLRFITLSQFALLGSNLVKEDQQTTGISKSTQKLLHLELF